MKNRIAIVVHGGAGGDSGFIRMHRDEYYKGLERSIRRAYRVMYNGGCAVDAVEIAVASLENNELFNAGRGSALNHLGHMEMDAAIMDGSNMKAGAVSLVNNVKHPISLARAVMEKTSHVYISGHGTTELARSCQLDLAGESYFITSHQEDELKKAQVSEFMDDLLRKKTHGTVGAVAMDLNGNIAAGTSTGGSVNCLPGRIGDSCIIGSGCYANNRICAVSGTGDGEYLITGVIAHSIAASIHYERLSAQDACDKVIFTDNAHVDGDLGVICISPSGDIGIAFNTERMPRAWIDTSGKLHTGIYKEEY
jgi:beta-aspartyl-peptidase (threonine type)